MEQVRKNCTGVAQLVGSYVGSPQSFREVQNVMLSKYPFVYRYCQG